MKKKNKYITVLDFEVARVFQYKTDIILSEHQHGFYEDFLMKKGHRMNNIEWMVHAVAGIVITN